MEFISNEKSVNDENNNNKKVRGHGLSDNEWTNPKTKMKNE